MERKSSEAAARRGVGKGRAIGLAQSVTVNGTQVALSGTTPTQHSVRKFRATVPLQVGRNLIHVVTTGTNGETYHRDLLVIRENASGLELKITSPRTKDVLASSAVVVQGTVTVVGARVVVNGVTATITPNAGGDGGTFEATVPVTASGRIQAVATFGSDTSGDQVDVLRAPFDMHFDLGYDRSVSRRPSIRFLGAASVPMQSVRINGTNLAVSGSTFDGTIPGFVQAGSFGRYVVEATTLAGDIARFEVLVKYDPHRLAVQNPGRARIWIDIDAPAGLMGVTNWALPPLAAWSPYLRSTPFHGRVTPDTIEKVAPGKYRLYANVEAHGFQTLPTVAAASTVELRNATGQSLYSAVHDFVWTVDSKPSYGGVFITSIGNGDVTQLLGAPVMGVLANIQAQSVTVNGQPASFDSSNFWTYVTGFERGANAVTVNVTDVTGRIHTDTVHFSVEPRRVTVVLDPALPALQVDLHVLQRGSQVPGTGGFVELSGVPPSYDWTGGDFSTVYVSTFNRYFVSPPNTYYELRYPTYWPRDSVLASELGIWEISLFNGYNHAFWVNFVSPTEPTAVSLLSHEHGQSVSGSAAVIQVTTPNNGASEVTINGISAEQTLASRPCCGDRTRVDQIHTASVPLVLGPNTITVTASGPVPGTATFTINRAD